MTGGIARTQSRTRCYPFFQLRLLPLLPTYHVRFVLSLFHNISLLNLFRLSSLSNSLGPVSLSTLVPFCHPLQQIVCSFASLNFYLLLFCITLKFVDSIASAKAHTSGHCLRAPRPGLLSRRVRMRHRPAAGCSGGSQGAWRSGFRVLVRA